MFGTQFATEGVPPFQTTAALQWEVHEAWPVELLTH